MKIKMEEFDPFIRNLCFTCCMIVRPKFFQFGLDVTMKDRSSFPRSHVVGWLKPALAQFEFTLPTEYFHMRFLYR